MLVTDRMGIQGTQMETVRHMKCYSKRDGIINEDISTELGILIERKRQKKIEMKASPGTCISNQAVTSEVGPCGKNYEGRSKK